MTIRPDEQTDAALKRLRLLDDFKRVVSTLEDLRSAAEHRLVWIAEDTSLRQQQGRAQQLDELIEWLTDRRRQ